MTLEEEFKQIIENNLCTLFDCVIEYIIKSFYSLSIFVTKKTHKSTNFTYDNTDKIIHGFYQIGLENCKKEYEYYQSILKFQNQAKIDCQIMKQIRSCYFTITFNENEFKKFNNTISYQTYNYQNKKIMPDFDKEFYVKKYKFYNSFKITLS
jgi:hypothetical protein